MATPLSDSELDRLDDLLGRLPSDRAMNLEQVDGFAALVCTPDTVFPSEYLPVIGDGKLNRAGTLTGEEAQELIRLLLQHWDSVSGHLQSGNIYTPLLFQDETGTSLANDWAEGFTRGMQVRPELWATLLADDENAGALVPIFALAHEHDPPRSCDPILSQSRTR